MLETLLAALKAEIALQIKSTIDAYQRQIQKQKTREHEVTEALSATEEENQAVM